MCFYFVWIFLLRTHAVPITNSKFEPNRYKVEDVAIWFRYEIVLNYLMSTFHTMIFIINITDSHCFISTYIHSFLSTLWIVAWAHIRSADSANNSIVSTAHCSIPPNCAGQPDSRVSTISFTRRAVHAHPSSQASPSVATASPYDLRA